MKSDTLITILLSILAIVFGIINARAKKRRAESRIPVFTEEPQFQFSRPAILQENFPEEAIRTTENNVEMKSPVLPKDHDRVTTRQGKRKYGFNAKQAVLFSEILKPKYDEFC